MRRLPPGAQIVTAAQMRAAEQLAFDSGISQIDLMERAGAAVAYQTARLAAGRRILVLAGPGNNGGDAYVAARHLSAAGLDVAVATLGLPGTTVAEHMASAWHGPTVPLGSAAPRPVVLDGLFGIGAVRPLDDMIAQSFEGLLRAAELRIAIDLPSGMDADSGTGGIAVDVSIALGAVKPGHLASDRSGHVVLVDIGVPNAGPWSTIATPRLPALRHDVNKFSRGMVVVVGGAMPGAGWLAASAALHSGAGYVILTGDASASGAPHALIRRTIRSPGDLEQVLDDDRIDTVVVGPGLGRDARAVALLDVALGSRHDLVVDGDALSLLRHDVAIRLDSNRRAVCLTPHSGEFDRMFASAGTKIERTVAAAREVGATIIHKGADTVIASPDGSAIVAAGGSPWLSTAGSGDVLAGLVAARLSSKQPPVDAASTAVWLHSRAATLAGVAFIADDLIGHIPGAMAQCRPI